MNLYVKIPDILDMASKIPNASLPPSLDAGGQAVLDARVGISDFRDTARAEIANTAGAEEGREGKGASRPHKDDGVYRKRYLRKRTLRCCRWGPKR